ncbi:MAG: hypothetical protein EOO17_04375 [Chloroflexi bacterium]|nr:MAG: hypothetical protein EOO17_04375 [Chloroflexota bacterium]
MAMAKFTCRSLLVGYVRGHKNKDLPLMTVSKKLFKRALLLYVWFVIMTLAYTGIIWYAPLIAAMPWIDVAKGDWTTLVQQTITMNLAHTWVHFLYMYAIFLALTPIAIWLLRRNKAPAVLLLSVIGYGIGKHFAIEWLEWLPVFFVPAVAGYYLPAIQTWWHGQNGEKRRRLKNTLYAITVGSLVISIFTTFIFAGHSMSIFINDFFSKEFTLDFWRIILSFVWFVALVLLFNQFLPWLRQHTKWLLIPFGTNSLTAYIAHGMVVILIGFLFIDSNNIVTNTLLGIVAILGVWALLRIPFITKILPR